MCLGDSHKIEFVFFPLCGSALLILPSPHFAANNVLQTGRWDCEAKNLPLGRTGEKILVAGIRGKLNVKFTARALGIHRMLESLQAKPGSFQFPSNLLKISCDHNNIDIHRVNRFNVAIHREAALQTCVDGLIYAYCSLGHTIARIDPLAEKQPENPLLSLRELGFSESDLDLRVSSKFFLDNRSMTLREMLAGLERIYADSI